MRFFPRSVRPKRLREQARSASLEASRPSTRKRLPVIKNVAASLRANYVGCSLGLTRNKQFCLNASSASWFANAVLGGSKIDVPEEEL